MLFNMTFYQRKSQKTIKNVNRAKMRRLLWFYHINQPPIFNIATETMVLKLASQTTIGGVHAVKITKIFSEKTCKIA